LEDWKKQPATKSSNAHIDAALKKIRDAKKKDKELVKMTITMEDNYNKLGQRSPDLWREANGIPVISRPPTHKTERKITRPMKRDESLLMSHLSSTEGSLNSVKRFVEEENFVEASKYVGYAINTLNDSLKLVHFIHKEWYLSRRLIAGHEIEEIEKLAAEDVRTDYADITGAISDLEVWKGQPATKSSNAHIDAALKKVRDAKKKDKQLLRMTRTMENNYSKLDQHQPPFIPFPDSPDIPEYSKLTYKGGRKIMGPLRRDETYLKAYLRLGETSLNNVKRSVKNRKFRKALEHVGRAISALNVSLRLVHFIHKEWYLSRRLLAESN